MGDLKTKKITVKDDSDVMFNACEEITFEGRKVATIDCKKISSNDLNYFELITVGSLIMDVIDKEGVKVVEAISIGYNMKLRGYDIDVSYRVAD